VRLAAVKTSNKDNVLKRAAGMVSLFFALPGRVHILYVACWCGDGVGDDNNNVDASNSISASGVAYARLAGRTAKPDILGAVERTSGHHGVKWRSRGIKRDEGGRVVAAPVRAARATLRHLQRAAYAHLHGAARRCACAGSGSGAAWWRRWAA